MLIKMKKEKAEDLKDGRSYRYLSKKTGCTEQHLYKVFDSTNNCSKALAITLICIKYNFNIGEMDIESLLNNYFITEDN